MQLIEFNYDFETRSRIDLRKVGVVKYAMHPSTEATLLTWTIGDGSCQAWRYGQKIPAELSAIISHPEQYLMIAQNAEFDFLIWLYPWQREVKRQGNNQSLFKQPPLQNLSCTEARSKRFGSGRALDDAATMLQLPLRKDKEGRRLMLKQCKPNAKTDEFPVLTAEEWDRFEYYGKIDTLLLRQVHRAIPMLNPVEKWAWLWTMRENMTGLRIDLPLLQGMVRTLQHDLTNLNREFNTLVGHQFVLTQTAKYHAWLKQWMPNFPNMQAETIREVLEARPPQVPQAVMRTIEIKALASATSVAKVATCERRLIGDRLYDNLNYNGAFNMRWAGQGFQVQNMPRANPGLEINSAMGAVKGDPSAITKIHGAGRGVKLVKNLLRRLFLADSGQTFYCGDYSKIEPTVLFWLLGLGPIPKTIYEQMAADIFSLPITSIEKESDHRQLGKSSFLGCGYGMGPLRFKDQVKEQSGLIIDLVLSKKAVHVYRGKFPQIVSFWHQLSSAFLNATYGRTTELCQGKIVVAPMEGRFRGVTLQLPSGSKLHYHSAGAGGGSLLYKQAQRGKQFDKKVYGGLLCEHVASATAREIMVNGMMNSERAGFINKNTIHDEIWALGPPNKVLAFEAAMCALPAWAEGLSLGVDVMEGERYLK